MQKEKMNVSEFARFIGVSHTAVQKAIAAGKITGVTPDKKIIVSVALKEAKEWGLIKKVPRERFFYFLWDYCFEIGTSLALATILELNKEVPLETDLFPLISDKEMFLDALDEKLSTYLAEKGMVRINLDDELLREMESYKEPYLIDKAIEEKPNLDDELLKQIGNYLDKEIDNYFK